MRPICPGSFEFAGDFARVFLERGIYWFCGFGPDRGVKRGILFGFVVVGGEMRGAIEGGVVGGLLTVGGSGSFGGHG